MQIGTVLKITFWALLILGFSLTISHISDSQKSETIGKKNNHLVNNQSMTNNDPSYGWGWSDDYCLRNIKLKDGTIIRIPRCEF